MRTKYTLFFSWQSDIPGIKQKIITAIQKQAERIVNKINTQLHIDYATRDLPGSPKIEDAIFEKILNCDFFIADITPVTQVGDKQLPNVNVSIELGFAIKSLGWDRIILVACNNSDWKTENLPFDINHHRIGTFKPDESLNLEFEINACLKVCRSDEPKGFLFKGLPTEVPEVSRITKEPVIFFAQRIGQGFPGKRGLFKMYNKKEIIKHLQSFFNCRLKYEIADADDVMNDPIWWFRGGSACPIDKFEVLDDSHILLSNEELNIKRLIVYSAASGEYYRNYLYIEAEADLPCGTETHSEQIIQDFIYSRGFYSEEYAVFRPSYDSKEYIISREEYDDGAANIDGKIIPIEGKAELRTRYLTPYNCIVAAKDSPYNSREFDVKSADYLNWILQDKIEFDDFHEFMMSLERQDQI